MELLEQLEWINWKQLSDEEKLTVFQKALSMFVCPTIEISYMALADFELCGIKSRTIELEIDGELFVFVPGNNEAILGWDSGAEGLRAHELLGFNQNDLENSTFKTSLTSQEIAKIFASIKADDSKDFSSLEKISAHVNQRTTELRKVKISPMIIQKYALPAGTEFLGIFDVVSGVFKGEYALPLAYENRVKDLLYPKLEAGNCLSWLFPATILERNQFYMEFLPESDHYFVYSHAECTHTQLQERLAQKGYSLLNSDQWEYMAGAGTRRLFRWGNELLIQKNQAGKLILEKMNQSNMFGLVIDTTKTRYELTSQLERPKLEKAEVEKCHLIEKMLPLSTYYQTTHQVDANQLVSPETYLYRKAILMVE